MRSPLSNVTAVNRPTVANAGLDVLFGNLGQDFAGGFESFTLDFVGMPFQRGT